jgi:hypothetical protein
LTPPTWKRVADIPPGAENKDLARTRAITRWPARADLFARKCDVDRAEASSRKQWEVRRRRRNTEKSFVNSVTIQLDITVAAAAELCRRGMVAPGFERDPQAVAHGVIEAAARYLGLKGAPDPGIPIIPRG